MATSHGISPGTFNTYFTNIGSDLTKTFTDDVKLYRSLPESNHRFMFQQISEEEVLNNLNKLSHKSKQDVLGYDSRLLGDASDSLASSITSLFNMSLHTHHLPADWKKARVTPIYKGTGEVNEPNNYRPISVVSHISKCLKNVLIINYYNFLKVTLFYVMTNQLSEKVTPQERPFISWWMIYWIIFMKE